MARYISVWLAHCTPADFRSPRGVQPGSSANSAFTAMHAIEAKADGKPSGQNTQGPALSAMDEVEVSVHARLVQVDAAPKHMGQLILTIVSEMDGAKMHDGFLVQQPRLIIELPLASTEDAYGESRQCFISEKGP